MMASLSLPSLIPFLQENIKISVIRKRMLKEKPSGPAPLASAAKTPTWGTSPSLSYHLQLQPHTPSATKKASCPSDSGLHTRTQIHFTFILL